MAPVLSQALALVAQNLGPGAPRGKNIGDLARPFRCLEERERLPHDLVRCPAIQELGSLVPAQDQAGGRRSDDGVMRGFDDRREALQTRFGPPPVCDVDRKNELSLASAEDQTVRGDFDVDQRAVFRSMSPDTGVLVVLVVPGLGGDAFVKSRDVLGRTNVPDRHSEELLTRVSVVAARRLVDGQEGERLLVEHPHRLRVLLEEEPVPLFGLADRSLRALPFGDVDEGREYALKTADVDPDDGTDDVPNFSRACAELDLLEERRSLSLDLFSERCPVARVLPETQLERRAPEQLFTSVAERADELLVDVEDLPVRGVADHRRNGAGVERDSEPLLGLSEGVPGSRALLYLGLQARVRCQQVLPRFLQSAVGEDESDDGEKGEGDDEAVDPGFLPF